MYRLFLYSVIIVIVRRVGYRLWVHRNYVRNVELLLNRRIYGGYTCKRFNVARIEGVVQVQLVVDVNARYV